MPRGGNMKAIQVSKEKKNRNKGVKYNNKALTTVVATRQAN